MIYVRVICLRKKFMKGSLLRFFPFVFVTGRWCGNWCLKLVLACHQRSLLFCSSEAEAGLAAGSRKSGREAGRHRPQAVRSSRGISSPGFGVSTVTRTCLSLLQHQGRKVSIECVHLLREARVKHTHQDSGSYFITVHSLSSPPAAINTN